MQQTKPGVIQLPENKKVAMTLRLLVNIINWLPFFIYNPAHAHFS